MKLSDRELLLITHAAACAALVRSESTVDSVIESVVRYFAQSEETFEGKKFDVILANIKNDFLKDTDETK